jgi:hypothetical protein
MVEAIKDGTLTFLFNDEGEFIKESWIGLPSEDIG